MSSRNEVLNSLVEAVETRQDEGVLSTLGALAAGSALVAKALAGQSAPAARIAAAIPLARKLSTATSRAEEVEAVAGLLEICVRVLIRAPDYADIGHRIRHLATALRSRIGR